MNIRTPLERMNFSYSIAKKIVEEQGQHLEAIILEDKIQSSILKFVVIRDFPFLEDSEIEQVMQGIKTIIELAIGEKELKERKKYVLS